MPKILPYAALAAALAVAGSALAQPSSPTREAAPQTAAPQTATPQAATPPTSSPSAAPPASAAPGASAAAGTDAAANAGAGTTLQSGMSVKDNTGALIGEVKSVKGGVATIQMGSDTFTVDSDKLGVANGAASINATQAELKKMLPPKK
jgi:hypothetical protein